MVHALKKWLTPEEAAATLPSGRTHAATIRRWIRQGVQTPKGVIKLKGKKVGLTWFVESNEIEIFLDNLTHASVEASD